jgi:hypothetical protein
MSDEIFRDGYFAGWHSIRGDKPLVSPTYVPTPREAAFRMGVARGVRDAVAPSFSISNRPNIEAWIDSALRRKTAV